MKYLKMIKKWWLTLQIKQLNFDDARMNRLVSDALCDYETINLQASHRHQQNQRERLKLQNQMYKLDAQTVLKEVSQ